MKGVQVLFRKVCRKYCTILYVGNGKVILKFPEEGNVPVQIRIFHELYSYCTPVLLLETLKFSLCKPMKKFDSQQSACPCNRKVNVCMSYSVATNYLKHELCNVHIVNDIIHSQNLNSYLYF